ncbi:MAG: bifunctional riboflavin kinase/FAD synthetase [Lachnospiraceae bacterium]|nr:bifunctional riboflavin kinase/FAD synthetase [Lachnospiraceae bacterium]
MIYISGEETKQFHTVQTAIALGKFDGIHLGHQMLIEGLLKEKQKGRKALVFTFGSSPNEVLHGGAKKNIYTTEEKVYYFSRFGIDILLECPFTKEFASLAPEAFVLDCLVRKLGVRSVYVGQDFHFGRGRQGNVALLEAMGQHYHFEVHALNKKTLHGKVISSTTIRDMLETHFHVANEMLGNPYFIYGPVVHGKHLGHTIGYPTINQVISKQKLLPVFGVYASRVEIDGVYYRGISNLGTKPTIEGNHQVGLETHILDYQDDLYGRDLRTELLYFIRPEERFSGVDALKKQIQTDIKLMLEQETV